MPSETESSSPLLDALTVLTERRGHEPARRAAAKSLLTIVGQLARRPLRITRDRSVQLPPADVDELVAKVVLKLLEAERTTTWLGTLTNHLASAPVQDRASERANNRANNRASDRTSDPAGPTARDAEAHACAYVSRMLSNLAIDEHRRRRRLVQGDALLESVAERPAAFGAELGQLQAADDDIRPLLERLVEAAEASRPPRHRADLRRAWQQLSAMVFDGQSMDETLAEERQRLGSLDEPLARSRARILQAHRRLRQSLLATIDDQVAAGTLSRAEAAVARQAHDELLLRCHRPPPAA